MFTLENYIVAGEKLALTIAMMVAFVAVTLMVPARYFNLRLPDLNELGTTSVVIVAFLCIGLLVRTGGHISIEVTSLLKSQRMRFIFRQIANVGILLFVGTFGVQALKLLESAISSGEATLGMNIPLVFPFGALVVGLILAAFHTLMNCARDLKVLRSPGAEFEMEEAVIPE